MVVTKHFAVHSTKYRKSLIKYILNPKKTKQLKLVSDFGMSNYLDFPTYEELVEMYQANLTNNDRLYDSRNDRQQLKQTKIHAHHLIQSFSPEDKLTPEEINRIGYETIKELTGGNFRFIVATHTDRDHVHNHILINSIDLNSDKKLKWDYAQERNLRMISDRLAKEAGAKIIPPNRYSHEQFETYRKTNHKFELKQRLYFLMENSKNFEDFMVKAPALNVEMDFSRKHGRFSMTDRDMKQIIRGNQLDKRQPYTEDYFREQFAKRVIEQRLEFILPRARDLSHLLEIAEQLNLKIFPKKKHVTFTLVENDRTISIENKKVSTKHLYDVQFFEDYFDQRESITDPDLTNLVDDFNTYQEEQDKDKLPSEELLAAYKKFKEKRDKIQEFEVVLADHQIDKVVKDGLFIKMTYGIKKDGMVFIPNRNLDIHESEQGKSYHVFIRETAQFFIYNKENSNFNRYMRGRELIRQLTHDSKYIPKRRRPTMASLKEKIAELNLLIELDINNKSYQEVKDELIKDIAQLDLTITELQDKVAHLNKVAEVLLNLNNSDPENRRLARYDYAKMNLTSAIKLKQVEKEIEENQNSLTKWIDDYDYKVRRLENFVSILDNTRNQNITKLKQETKLI
ncbi:TPA: relaxase/mobilization nuclease domain-containing protein [Streptococcus equi subsp. zooepidemicus]|uniref:SAG1250 family conjugative relaxase n=1 Tax=Streptococcus equi TaxID=1336 RepID=UPI0005B8A70F|nr:SAG1250 family conjugative relaxase [Streptococcus equi]KIS06549.1 ORF4 relaxase [Streptococcus equi subsp. zooepidemicus Sz5]MCD3395978.1 relaxase/mobilization nuclease domain-containing protein [Streptococcus equi subsp. zooepidemicus]MCD3408126.1 relaxase/mobilization nuclease domain-containing protein [Streptococcus equi subsp. zooepidemicus]MCD3415780.1 relaxase/mobilization nuclease domain-containing protein [Streptococcus equi subsp. zooepidemicus]MDI5951793.1 SAG1250 family conjugat